MTAVNMKVVRQKLMQTTILNKVERDHLALNTERVRQSLQTVRDNVSRSPYLVQMLDRWEEIIQNNDVEALRRIVEADSETDREMRNLSPLHVLLTENERLQVIDDLRKLLGD